MSHWAEINEKNIVQRVIVCDDDDPNGDEGYQWLINTFGGIWIKCSYNTFRNKHSSGKTPLRGNFPGPGFTYNAEKDVFIPPKPFDSWILNTDFWFWEAPIPRPQRGPVFWNEQNENWEFITLIPEQFRTKMEEI